MSNSEQAVNQNKILVVDDDPYLLTAIRQTLTLHGYTVDTFDKPVEAMGRVAPGGYAAVVADVKMPKMNGLALLQAIRDLDEQLPVIMVTGHGDVAMAVTAMKNGAYDFLEKPVDDDELLASLARAVEKRNLVLENRSLNRALQMAKAAGPGFH